MKTTQNSKVVLASDVIRLIEENHCCPKHDTCEQTADEAHLVKEYNPLPVERLCCILLLNIPLKILLDPTVPSNFSYLDPKIPNIY